MKKNLSTPPVHPDDILLGKRLLKAAIAINLLVAALGLFPMLAPAPLKLGVILPILLTMAFGLMATSRQLMRGSWTPLARRAKRGA